MVTMRLVIALATASIIVAAQAAQADPPFSSSPHRQSALPPATQSLTQQPVERTRTNAERRTAPEQDYVPWHVRPNRQTDRPWHCDPEADRDCE